MARFLAFLSLAFSFSCYSARAQEQHTVRGTVRDAFGMPIPHAHVRLSRGVADTDRGIVLGAEGKPQQSDKGLSQKGQSDPEGNFALSGVPAGTYTLHVSCVGYGKIQQGLTAPTSSPLRIILTETASLLEEVVIRNIRQEENQAVARSLVTRKDIETKYLGENTHFFVQNFTPSLVTSSQGGNNFSNYGGFRLRGMEDDRVNVTLNGVPLNGMVDYALYFSNFSDLTQSMESIEVQRGVGTSTSGMASYAGSMNLQSMNIFSDQRGSGAEIGGTVGSFSSRKLHAAYNTGKKESGFASYLRASVLGSDGYRRHSGTQAYSSFASSGWQGERYTLKLTGLTGNTKNDMAYTPVAEEAIKKDPRTNPTNPSETDNYTQSLAMLEQHYQLSEGRTLSATLYYGSARGHYLWGYTADTDYYQVRGSLNQWRVGSMANVEIAPKDKPYSLRLGGHTYNFSREDTSAAMPDYTADTAQEAFIKREFSLFAKAGYALNKWHFTADVQGRSPELRMRPANDNVEKKNRKFFTRHWWLFSPKLGVSYTLFPRATLYASAAYTEREPAHRDYLGGAYVLNDENLKTFTDNDLPTEKVMDLEVGTRYQPHEALSVNVNGFFMFFENEIVPSGAFLPEYYLDVTQSMPNSRRIGVEAEGKWDVLPSLRFSLLTTLMQSRINETSSKVKEEEEGDFDASKSFEAPFTPTWQLAPSLQYQVHGVTVALDGRYLSQAYLGVPNDESAVLPSSFVVNGGISYLFKERYFLSIQAANLLNALYYTDGSVKRVDEGGYLPRYIVQPPRTVFLQLNVKM